MESIEYYQKEQSFAGKNVVITGGTGGIGSQLAHSLLKLGAKVLVVAKSERKLIEKFGTIKYNIRKRA